MTYETILLTILLSLVSLTQQSFALTGKVIGVADGDTITILDSSKKQHKIRLYGIDTPEKKQAFGKAAKKYTSRLTYKKQATVKVYDTDRYGRTVGVVKVGGINVNESLIRVGLAWQYRKYCKASFCENWLQLEKAAKKARLGLWKDPHAQVPWEYRKAKRTGTKSVSKPNAIGRYHGNVKSKVLHAPGCQHYNCKNCSAGFKSISTAKQQGYRVHKQCVGY